MPKISIENIVPGMILAKPVEGANGMVLLSEGTELGEKWIERLDAMGIDGVWVEGKTEQAVPIEEALAALDERFGPVLEAPYMRAIMKLVRLQIEKLYV
jgi:hypothetical protein